MTRTASTKLVMLGLIASKDGTPAEPIITSPPDESRAKIMPITIQYVDLSGLFLLRNAMIDKTR